MSNYDKETDPAGARNVVFPILHSARARGGVLITRAQKSRGVYILLALIFWSAGVHNFYAGHISRAILQLAACTVGWLPMWVVAIVLTKIDPAAAAVALFGYAFTLVSWVVLDVVTIKTDGAGVPFS